jgi:hypothetical protein
MARTPSDSSLQTARPAIARRPGQEAGHGKVLTLLQRKNGATLAELVAATGWQPHPACAALSGLRNRDHVIERSRRGGARAWIFRGDALEPRGKL